MTKQSQLHPIFFARQHYARVRMDRRFAQVRLEIRLKPAIGHRLLGHLRPNQHTKRRLMEHFSPMDSDSIFDALDRAAWLHGRICIPHPACPEAFELCRWISYHDAVAITGRSAHTFARWRWDHDTIPDEAVWRLLEAVVHECCAWPPRPPRSETEPLPECPLENSPYPAVRHHQ